MCFVQVKDLILYMVKGCKTKQMTRVVGTNCGSTALVFCFLLNLDRCFGYMTSNPLIPT